MGFIIFLGVLASIAGIAAWIWMIVTAFKAQDRLWGTLLIVAIIIPFIGPFLPIVYSIVHFQRCRQAAYLFYSALAANILVIILAFAGISSQIKNSPELQEAMAQATEARARARGTAIPESPESPAVINPAEATDPTPPPQPPPPAPPRPKPQPAPTAAAAATNATPAPPAIDPNLPPARLEMISIGAPTPNRLRPLRLRIFNDRDKPIREVKLQLTYIDAKEQRLGTWTTVHSESPLLVGPKSTNEFDMTAFFVPQFTSRVQVGLAGLVYGDGSRWP